MFSILKNFNKKAWIFFAISVIFIVAGVWLDLKIPDYMSEITRLLQYSDEGVGPILTQGGLMMLCALGSLVATVITCYCAAYIGASFSYTLRKRFFDKVQRFNLTEIKKFSISSLITRSTNDVRQVHIFVIFSVQVLIKAPVMAILAISKIANKGFEFSMITAIGVGIIVALMIVLVAIVMPKFKMIQQLTDNLNRIARENLNGVRVVRAYNAEKYQERKFAHANKQLTETQLFAERMMILLGPTITTVMPGLSLAIYWVGAALINTAGVIDRVTIFGNVVVFSSYAIQVIMAFLMLVVVFVLYPRAHVSLKRLNAVLDTPFSIKNGEITTDCNDLRGVVEFKNVSFQYPDAEAHVFRDISFKANPGETIAFIGSTGSGKSTLINLIPRFYDATEGNILIDGIDITKLDTDYLHSKIGYISQKATLFKGTVNKNIRLGYKNGKKPTKDAVKKAIKIAQAQDFVEKMPGSYNAKIAQNGTNISGGQRQRLSIARAIARNPEIYIFDDSFSALDYKTDHLLRKELNRQTKNATKFIVAQRIGTIKDADQILVLDKGHCVGHGKHADLMKNCAVYREIALSQLSEKELEKTK